jgi:hypothetical protein
MRNPTIAYTTNVGFLPACGESEPNLQGQLLFQQHHLLRDGLISDFETIEVDA